MSTTDEQRDQQRDEQGDRLEQEIYVTVDAEEAWALVSRPGWWINEGEIDDHPETTTDGAVTTLVHPVWGTFTVETVEARRPAYVAYRWATVPDTAPDAPTTTVELWLESRPGGSVLRVSESGFAALSDDADVWRRSLADQTEGWANELRAARAFLTAHRG